MTDTSTRPAEDHGGQPLDKGLKVGAIGLVSAIVIGVASTAPGYSLAASLGFMTESSGAQGAGDPGHRLHPDAVHRSGVLLPEPGRSRLRHDLHLGHARDRTEDGLDRRMGRSSSPTSS